MSELFQYGTGHLTVKKVVAIASIVALTAINCYGLKLGAWTQNILTMLKPGGRFSLIEISVPPSLVLRYPYMFYLKSIIPLVGRIFMGNPENYRMLGIYTDAFRNCEQFSKELNRIGLVASSTSHFFGCATGVIGYKPIT